MRTYLRVLAGALVGMSAVLAVGSVGAAGYYYSATGGRLGGAVVWAAVAPVFALLAGVGLLMFHLAGTVLPAPPGQRPAYRPVRWVLRVTALVQMVVGGLLIVAAVVYAGDRILVRPTHDVGSALVTLFVAVASFSVTCLGGLLWCAVRLAYPVGWGDEA